MKGVFITFEGIDGCGKTTQAQLLVRSLQERGVKTLHTWEPGGTELGQEIRRLFLHMGRPEIDATTETLLMAADRSDHVERVIKPALARGETVISERFIDSTEAYQGYAGGVSIDAVRAINAFASRGLEPTITFLLDLDPEEAAQRRSGRCDRMEAKEMAFHHKVREGYLKIQRRRRDRIFLVDASLPVREVHDAIVSTLLERGVVPGRGGSDT